MSGEPATGVRFFHLSSRLNRLRYFSYSMAMAWLSTPVGLLSMYLTVHQDRILGLLLSLASDIFFLPIQLTFLVRRLHDMGKSGWWSSIYVASLPFFLLRALGIRAPSIVAIMLLFVLVDLVFLLVVLFSAGTPGENNFGPVPPPNGTGVIALAWSALLFFPTYVFFIVMIGVSALGSGLAIAAKSNYAVTIARRGAEQARLYHEVNKSWPTDFGDVFGGELTQGVPYRVTTIKYPDGSYGLVVTNTGSLTGEAVEVWTTDGGESWHCGPAYAKPMPKESLPDNCQEDSPAIP